MNKVILIGRLTKNPELKYTESNLPIVQFSLAVTRNYKSKNGDYEADFINCIAFKKLAETINLYLSKGDRIGVEGRINTRSYTNKENKKTYITEIIVENIDFLTPKKDKTETKKEESDPFNDLGNSFTSEELDDIELPFE